MSASNNQRSKMVNYIYHRLAASDFGKDIRIERDSLRKKYDVNKYSLNIYIDNAKNENHYKSLASRFQKMINEGLSLEKKFGYFQNKEGVVVNFSVNYSENGPRHYNAINVFVF